MIDVVWVVVDEMGLKELVGFDPTATVQQSQADQASVWC